MQPQRVKPYNEIPLIKWSLPYFGISFHHALRILPPVSEMSELLMKYHGEYGPIVRERYYGEEYIHLFNPNDYEIVYKREGKAPLISPLLPIVKEYREMRGFSAGVGNLNGEQWYRLRSAVNPLMMKTQSVQDFLDLEQEVADEFIEVISKSRNPHTKQVSDLEGYISRWNFETAGYIVLGRRLHAIEETSAKHEINQMIKCNDKIFQMNTEFSFAAIPFHRWWKTSKWKKFSENEDFFYGNIVNYFNESVDKVKTLHQLHPGELGEEYKGYRFLSYLMRLESLNMKDVYIVSQSLFTDGLSTIVPTLQTILYCLAVNGEKQEKLRQEVLQKVGRKGPVTIQTLQSMPYLKACVKEAFRFFPIGPDVSRITTEDIVLSGYQIPAQSKLILDNSVLLKDKKYFREPERYLPERWLRGPEREDIHPYILLPFSHGPRMCLGRRFAEQEMYLILIKLMQNFRLHWRGERAMGQRFQMLFVPDCPPDVAFEDLP